MEKRHWKYLFYVLLEVVLSPAVNVFTWIVATYFVAAPLMEMGGEKWQQFVSVMFVLLLAISCHTAGYYYNSVHDYTEQLADQL